jgi:spore coat protein CotH
MDVNLFLKTYAVNVTVGMWDDYWSNSNNYYFYFDAAGKFYFIPYDYDNTLGTSLLMTDSGIQDPLNWGKMQTILWLQNY